MADKQKTDAQKRNIEIARLKQVNQQLREKSQSKQQKQPMHSDAEDSLLMSFFSMFRFS